MNLFVLDSDPIQSARLHVDKHVVQMIREGIWILEAGKWLVQKQGDKPGWADHPLAKWVISSAGAWKWMVDHTEALLKEYTYRYGKVHAQQKQLEEIRDAGRPGQLPMRFTPFLQIVPGDCRRQSTVEAYRLYYSKHKYPFARWTKRDIPEWFNPFLTGRHE